MTCVVGLVRGNNLVLAGDSAAVCDDGAASRHARKEPKVFKLRDDFVLGFAGSFRQADIIRYKWELPEYRNQGIRRYVATDVIDTLRKTMKKNKLSMDDFGPLLIGFRKKLFTVDVDFHVGESRDCYASIGAGDYYALGAFETLKLTGGLKVNSVPDMKNACKLVLKATCHHSGAVMPPFSYVHIISGKK